MSVGGNPESAVTVLDGPGRAGAGPAGSDPEVGRSVSSGVAVSSRARNAGAAGATPEDREAKPGRARLRQIDTLRVLSCFSVITIHAVGSPFPADSVGLGETSFLLHYSREVFFFVSALVLVRTYYPRLGPNGRLPDEAGFRWRRLRLIGVPYLWWSTLYLALSIFHARASEPVGQTLNDLPLRWLYLVATGNASYHMYFLLVTLQYGVLFPLVLRLLRRTQGRHGRVLLASAVLQAATLACYHWMLLPGDGWRGLLGDASLPAYQFWLVAGAIAGLHLERWHRWVTDHRRWVLGAVPVAAAVLLWTYWAQVPTLGGLGASSPLQPVMMLWSTAALGALYLAAVWLTEHAAPWVRRAFGYGAQLSFGVYLAHPMVLDLVLAVLRRTGILAPSVWVSLLALALTTVITVVVCAALHRTPLSLSLMGRARLATAETAHPSGLAVLVERWLPRVRSRLVTVPGLVLAASVLAVLVVGGDQTPATETGTPSWEETVEASDPSPAGDTDCPDPATAAAVGPMVADCTPDSTAVASSAASAATPPAG